MAERPFTCPVAQPADVPPRMRDAAIKWQQLALKWRDIAERRSAHHVEMFYSGRWRHYYSDEQFLTVLRSAVLMARRWSAIAPERPGGADDVKLPTPRLRQAA